MRHPAQRYKDIAFCDFVAMAGQVIILPLMVIVLPLTGSAVRPVSGRQTLTVALLQSHCQYSYPAAEYGVVIGMQLLLAKLMAA